MASRCGQGMGQNSGIAVLDQFRPSLKSRWQERIATRMQGSADSYPVSLRRANHYTLLRA